MTHRLCLVVLRSLFICSTDFFTLFIFFILSLIMGTFLAIFYSNWMRVIYCCLLPSFNCVLFTFYSFIHSHLNLLYIESTSLSILNFILGSFSSHVHPFEQIVSHINRCSGTYLLTNVFSCSYITLYLECLQVGRTKLFAIISCLRDKNVFEILKISKYEFQRISN